MKIHIHSAPSEMDASIIKGYLENAGILASISSGANSLSINSPVLRGPNASYGIFVEEEKVDEAKNILKKITI